MGEASARSRVEDLLYRYAEALDDGALEDWPALFTDAGEYRLIPRENHAHGLPVCLMQCVGRGMMEDRVVAIREASVFSPHVCRHLYTNVRVAPDPEDGDAGVDAWLARANYAVYRTMGDGESQLLSVGRVLARVRLEPVPCFTRMDVVYETFRIPGLLVYPL
ncbi:aromatic-ring-hydroxylating dioxygenase subunit beta [Melittangium boletus]|uniref:aromatic-ring-hydroxylating dioxygenase subunit beta n=1 Tax=Melittangium boletus TaxID=83453 RepID=UPI003DA25673